MTAREKQLLGDALQLSTKQRARLAAELLASIDGEIDPDAEVAWAKEIERRARRALAGKSKGAAWSVVKARVRKSSAR